MSTKTSLSYSLAGALMVGLLGMSACKGDSADTGPGAAASGTMYVTAEKGLNLREKPSAASKKTGGLASGAKVTVLRRMPDTVKIGGRSGQWTKVKGPGGTGWAFGAYLSSKKPASAPAGGTGTLSGKFESDCDPDATLTFKPGNKVTIRRNVCEGYETVTWGYSRIGANVNLGTSGDPVPFRVRADGNLEYLEVKYSMITCGNCKKGDIWKKK